MNDNLQNALEDVKKSKIALQFAKLWESKFPHNNDLSRETFVKMIKWYQKSGFLISAPGLPKFLIVLTVVTIIIAVFMAFKGFLYIAGALIVPMVVILLVAKGARRSAVMKFGDNEFSAVLNKIVFESKSSLSKELRNSLSQVALDEVRNPQKKSNVGEPYVQSLSSDTDNFGSRNNNSDNDTNNALMAGLIVGSMYDVNGKYVGSDWHNNYSNNDISNWNDASDSNGAGYSSNSGSSYDSSGSFDSGGGGGFD